MKKKYITLLAIISLWLGVVGFIAGLITISLGYNIVFSVLLLVSSLLLATQSSLLFTYPHGKVLQDEKIRELEWKFKEVTARVNNLLLNASHKLIDSIIKEVKNQSKENKDETVY